MGKAILRTWVGGMVVLLLVVTSLPGCDDTGGATDVPSRSYRMGFSAIPPRAVQSDVVRGIEMWSKRSDAAMMSIEPPWDALLSGVSPESGVVANQLPLANYFRAKGLKLWVYLDPGNGLNRAGESDPLVRRGRSITEPEIQALYRRYAVAIDSLLHPDHFGLALETNLIRAASPPVLYDAIRQVVNDAASDVRARDSIVALSISVQVDYAWGTFEQREYRGVDTDVVHFPFIQELGLSSYPYLSGWAEPESLPLNYYSRLVQGRSIPVFVTEGGWTSVSLGEIQSTPDKQRRYIVRQFQLLDEVKATGLFQLTFTDLDLTDVVLPPGSILPLFAHLGLVDSVFTPKPALRPWDGAFRRPLAAGEARR